MGYYNGGTAGGKSPALQMVILRYTRDLSHQSRWQSWSLWEGSAISEWDNLQMTVGQCCLWLRQPRVPSYHLASGGGPAGQAGPRRIKLSAVLDPTLDADIVPLTEGEVTRMYDAYRSKFGDFPTDDADVSRDQLAAVRQVVQAKCLPIRRLLGVGSFWTAVTA